MSEVIQVEDKNFQPSLCRPKAKLAEALAKAQSTMQNAIKDTDNPYFKSTYADLTSCFDAMREPFCDNGLSICQTMSVAGNRTLIQTTLLHASGESMESEMLLPNLDNPQKLGSAITYYRRYMLCAIAGIAPADDDGNDATNEVGVQKKINENKTTPEPLTKLPKTNLQKLTNEERKLIIFELEDYFSKKEKEQDQALAWAQVKSFKQASDEKLKKLLDTSRKKGKSDA